MAEVDRRTWLKITAAGAAVAAAGPARAVEREVAKVSALRVGEGVAFNYPDDASPCWLIKLDHAVANGAGPGRDIVAYSALCTHQGCPVIVEEARFICPCHYSQFDPAVGGQCYQGVATMPLPQVELVVRDGRIFATGLRGLPWGRVEVTS